MRGLFKGLATTLATAIRGPVTLQYPDEMHPLPVRQRSFPVLLWDFDHDEPACTGCNICVRNCPVDCMTAIMHDNPKYAEGTSDRRKIVEKFWIDYARCMRCNICVEVCPFEAIVMDNTWDGLRQVAFDRRDLHRDIDDLTRASREGRLTHPWRPQDSIAANAVAVTGEGEVEPSFKGSRPEARARQLERLEKGLPAAVQEREPEKPKEEAPAAASGPGAAPEEAALTPRKARARRMRAEREIKALEERGEPVPAELKEAVERYRAIEAGGQAPVPAGAPAGTPASGAGQVLSGTNEDGSMRFPPGVGTGPKGDPNSLQKVRARRMRAERAAKQALEAGEPIPEDVAKVLYELGSDLAPGRTIWEDLAARGEGEKKAAEASAPSGEPRGEGAWKPPPGVGTGPKGDPNSFQKVRARRMRAERRVREALAAGETPDPEDIALIKELGGNLPEGVS